MTADHQDGLPAPNTNSTDAPVPGRAGQETAIATRRAFLLAGLGACLSACASNDQVASTLPGPAWDLQPAPYPPAPPRAAPIEPAPMPNVTSTAGFGMVLPRSRWASGRPVPALMDSMTSIRCITVHHDGMRPFYGDDAQAAAARLDAIRRGHRSKEWGDIGYHFAVDRAGNVWEGRPLVYQGAHVKNHNEGNVGIVALGNFERQRPTDAQVIALRRHIGLIMRMYRVPNANVRTHREWAPTACPGRHLQYSVANARSFNRFV